MKRPVTCQMTALKQTQSSHQFFRDGVKFKMAKIHPRDHQHPSGMERFSLWQWRAGFTPQNIRCHVFEELGIVLSTVYVIKHFWRSIGEWTTKIRSCPIWCNHWTETQPVSLSKVVRSLIKSVSVKLDGAIGAYLLLHGRTQGTINDGLWVTVWRAMIYLPSDLSNIAKLLKI